MYQNLVNRSIGVDLPPSGDANDMLHIVASLLSSHFPCLLQRCHHDAHTFIRMRIFSVMDSTILHDDSAVAAPQSSSLATYSHWIPNSFLNSAHASHTCDHTPSLSITMAHMIW